MTEKNKHGQYVNPGNQGFQFITKYAQSDHRLCEGCRLWH